MLFLAGLLFRFLAFGMLVVPALGLEFNFTDIQQCDSVVMTFSGVNDIATVPTSLLILPLNSTSINIPLQNPSPISSAITLNFLPLSAGSDFLASLDDATGENVISVSALTRVLPSENSSCLPSPDSESPRRFTIGPTITQCEDLSISYDVSIVSHAPTVRLFTPRGGSVLLNQTSNSFADGTATYALNASHGTDIVLLIDDGVSIKETSPLLTVGGDSDSDKSCLNNDISTISPNTMMSNGNNGSTANSTPMVSIAVLIGSITGGTIVLLIATAMVIFVIRDRRRRRLLTSLQFDPSAMEKALNTEKTSPNEGTLSVNRTTPTDPAPVFNPIYTTKSFLSTGRSTKGRNSMASWTQVIPEDQRQLASSAATSSSITSSRIVVVSPSSRQRSNRQSVETLDIEGMLNMAALQSENNVASRKNSDATVLLGPVIQVPSSFTTPTPTFLRPETSRRQLRNIPSDVTAEPTSMAFSATYSVNPFDENDAVFQEPLRTGDSLRSPGGGLPISPRASSLTKMFSGASARSSSNWYAEAR